MPLQKKFLDQNGLIQLLQEIESLDKTNIKDVYWSTDNADTYPTIVFKVGDDNGSPHSIKKFTFKGDTTSPVPTNATAKSIILTIGGTDKTITYYDTTNSAGITYTNATDSNQPNTATDVKTALDRVITKLSGIITDLNTVATGKGADMVAYSSNDSVKDALDDIYLQIGSGNGNSLTSRIEALEDGDNLIQGTNVTLTKDTTNHTVTIAASDQKVAQTEDTSTTANIPLLLASGSTPTTAGAKYYPALSFRPSTGALVVSKVGPGGSLSTNNVTISEGEISLADGIKTATISLQNNVFQFSGNSATATNATNDGSGNNIVNTYATKAALNELTNKWTGQFKIATAAEAAAIGQGDASSLELGYIYLVLDTGASSPNVYDEYIKVALGTSPETYSVEKIGTTDAGVDVISIPATGSNSVASLFETYVLNA